eukprot:UN25797
MNDTRSAACHGASWVNGMCFIFQNDFNITFADTVYVESSVFFKCRSFETLEPSFAPTAPSVSPITTCPSTIPTVKGNILHSIIIMVGTMIAENKNT